MTLADAKLINMEITFHTTSDDKDSDTRLEVWINKQGDLEAAYTQEDGEQYPNNSSHTLAVPPKSNPMLFSEVPGSWIQIRIHPYGHDTWRFSFDATLTFSDGTSIQRHGNETTLDQTANQQNFPL